MSNYTRWSHLLHLVTALLGKVVPNDLTEDPNTALSSVTIIITTL